MVKMVPRGFTATADAYLTPHIMRSASTHCCASVSTPKSRAHDRAMARHTPSPALQSCEAPY